MSSFAQCVDADALITSGARLGKLSRTIIVRQLFDTPHVGLIVGEKEKIAQHGSQPQHPTLIAARAQAVK